MAAYFIRRLLLVPITFLAITFMVYAVLRVVPGGPIEQAEAKRRMSAMLGGGGGGSAGRTGNESDLQLDNDGLKELAEYYSLDRAIPVGYLQWLGAWPRPFRTRVPASTQEKFHSQFQPLRDLQEKQQALQTRLDELLATRDCVPFQDRIYAPLSDADKAAAAAQPGLFQQADALARRGFGKRDELLAMLAAQGYTYAQDRYYKLFVRTDAPADAEFFGKAEELLAGLRLAGEKLGQIRRERGFEITEDGIINKMDDRFSGILQLDFRNSYMYGEPVLHLIGSKMEVSIQFGLIGYLLTWLVCVPLGVISRETPDRLRLEDQPPCSWATHAGFVDACCSW